MRSIRLWCQGLWYTWGSSGQVRRHQMGSQAIQLEEGCGWLSVTCQAWAWFTRPHMQPHHDLSRRTAPSKRDQLCTRRQWFGRPSKICCEPDSQLPMSITGLRDLAKFRVGSQTLHSVPKMPPRGNAAKGMSSHGPPCSMQSTSAAFQCGHAGHAHYLRCTKEGVAVVLHFFLDEAGCAEHVHGL